MTYNELPVSHEEGTTAAAIAVALTQSVAVGIRCGASVGIKALAADLPFQSIFTSKRNPLAIH